mgnify:CR=1 FL=1
MKILFICNGSVKIGMGHITRCLTLASYMKKTNNCKITFLIQKSKSVIDYVKNYFQVISPPNDEISYVDWLIKKINSKKINILILDIRNDFKKKDLLKLKQLTKIKIITIDDSEEKRLASDIAFYPPVPQVNKMNWQGFDGLIFTGLEYSILREEFLKEYPRKKNKSPILLVSMGGTDEKNLTTQVVKKLSDYKHQFDLLIIVGRDFPYISELKKALNLCSLEYQLKIDPTNVAATMAKADFALISFGMTAYELYALKIPSLYLCLTKDHEESSKLFEGLGCGRSLGNYSRINERDFNDILSKFTHSKKHTFINENKISNMQKITSKILGEC